MTYFSPPMFAIIDIETTGGHSTYNGITEIAIVLHNGNEVEGKFQTLVNPQMPIQRYVQSLTGITDAMVAAAPTFEKVAPQIYNLLKDRIFIAHNVNFDYAFVKQHLKEAGFEFNQPKLCTIRLSRKIFPGLPKYGLESLCRELNIPNKQRHRAAGDAIATTQLFELLLKHDQSGELSKMMKHGSKEQYLPPNVAVEKIQQLPYMPGVYYFHNKKGKIIYVGKAKNLKRRVTSHFSNNKTSKQKQEFLREIHDITWKELSSDFIASLFESIEIKRLWPIFNKSQKHFEQRYALYLFEDVKGYYRLGIDKKRKLSQPIISFKFFVEAHRTLWKLVKEHELHPALCFLEKEHSQKNILPDKEEHNKNIQQALASLKEEMKTYLLHDGKNGYVFFEEGKFYGLGILSEQPEKNKDVIKSLLTPYPENEILLSLVRTYAEKFPQNIIEIE
jgi:DNA polymerase-3 subunit epsilon